MLNNRLAAARSVAPVLHQTETLLDNAVVQTSDLVTTLIGARRHANLSTVVGQSVLDCVAQSLQLQVQAQAKMVEAHQLLDGVKTNIGLRTFAIGTGGGEKTMSGDSGPLASGVANAA
jgi:hypothetical protein